MGAIDVPGAAVTGGRVADRLAALFPGERVSLVAGIDVMAARFDALRNQRPATCGAYSLSDLLRAPGFATQDGVDLAGESFLAHLADVTREPHEIEPSAQFARRFIRAS